MVHETVHGDLDAGADGNGPHVMDAGGFFPLLGQFRHILELPFLQERTEQLPGMAEIQQAGKKAVFNIRNAVANIVRGLHQVGQGMAAPAQLRSSRLMPGEQSQFSRHEGSGLPFRLPDAEFLAFQPVGGNNRLLLYCGGIGLRTGVLHERSQNGARQLQSFAFHRVPGAGQDAEALGVPFKRMSHAVARQGGLNGVFPGMAEGRISDVMGQAGGGNDGGQSGRPHNGIQLLPLFPKQMAHVHAQGGTDVGHLQTVGQPRAHVIIAAQGEHLRFILKAAEGAGKQHAAVILVVLVPVLLRGRGALVRGPAPGIRQKLFPIHHPWHGTGMLQGNARMEQEKMGRPFNRSASGPRPSAGYCRNWWKC